MKHLATLVLVTIVSIGVISCRPRDRSIAFTKAAQVLLNEIQSNESYSNIMHWASSVVTNSSEQFLPLEATAPLIFKSQSSPLAGWSYMSIVEWPSIGEKVVFIEYAGSFKSRALIISQKIGSPPDGGENRIRLVTNGIWLYWR